MKNKDSQAVSILLTILSHQDVAFDDPLLN